MQMRVPKKQISVPITLLVTLLGSIPLSVGQSTIPPSQDDLEGHIDGVDEMVQSVDPTNGTLPSISTIQKYPILAALNEKLDTYSGLMESGAIPSVSLSEIDIDEISVTDNFLPNFTFSNRLDLLGLLDLVNIIESPIACVESSPSAGSLSTRFTFDASCSVDVDTATRDLEARWDWTGDGTYDTSWSSSLSSAHIYSTIGDKTPTVEIRDAEGNTATASTNVHVSNPPDACFSVSPSSGTTSTTFQVDAGCSSDDLTSKSSLMVRWDWTSDGTYDTSWTTAKTASHSYNGGGTKNIKLQVQDESYLTDTYYRSVSVSYPGGGGTGCPQTSAESNLNPNQPMSGGYSTPPPQPPCDPTTQQASGPAAECNPWDGDSPSPEPCAPTAPNVGGSAAVIPGGHVIDLVETEVEGTSEVLLRELNRSSVSEPVLFQRMPNAPYEPAQDGEALLAEGASLRLRPAAPPVSAIIDHEWLQESFGTYGSPAPYTFIRHDGRLYAHVTDPAILVGSKYAFEAIVLGQSSQYTNGHADMVELKERGMQISFPIYPGPITTTASREAPNGTVEEDTSTYQEERLGIDFSGENTAGQTVKISKEWLDGLNLTTPRFIHEDGATITSKLESAHYVIQPKHFSTIYIENFDDNAAQGWTFTGLWHTTTACASSYSGSYHIAYNKDSTCTYEDGGTTSGSATFSTTLTSSSSPVLSFYHRWTTESYPDPYDVMKVQISSNGGSSWNTLQEWDSTGSNQGSWKYQSYSLSSYAGYTVQIRFYFNSGDGLYNDFIGWLVDNVQVTETTGNFPPDACFTVSPTSGTTSTTFYVDAGCSTDTETSKSSLQVRWDWTNDGNYDTSWSTDKTTSHSYSSTGVKTIRLQVKDGGGSTDTYTKTVSVTKPNAAPHACFSTSPSSGSTITTFQFDAGCSSDPETSKSSLQARWDWTNDGSYDTSWTTSKTSYHTYSSDGTKSVKLQVKDGGGLTDTYVRSLSVSEDTAEMGLGEDFESTPSGWSMSGLWRRSGCRSAAGSYALAYNQGSCSNLNYDTGATTTGMAMTPFFEVPSAMPTLIFKSWHHTEGGGIYDAKHVEVRVKGSSSWTELATIGGNMKQWNTHSYSLDDYAGDDAQIRFRFDSKDNIYNDYSGWVIDDLVLKSEDRTIQYVTPWTHSTVDGKEASSYDHHDQSPDWDMAFQGDDDSILQKFYFSEEPEIGGDVYLYVLGKSFNCSGSAEITHEFLVNGQAIGQFAACAAFNDGDYSWAKFSFPSSLIIQGNNEFLIRGTCASCSEGMWIVTDDDSGDTYTDLVINGITKNGYEAYWYLFILYNEEFETMERYFTVETTNEDGTKSYEQVQEAFVFLDRQEMRNLYLMQRTKDDGTKSYMATTLEFEKRAEYTTGNKVSGLNHRVAQPQDEYTSGQEFANPTAGAFYTWHRVEWEMLIPNSDGAYERTQGRYMMLVPSNPEDPADKQGQGQNPFEFSAGDGGSIFKFDMEVDFRSCETDVYRSHFPWSDPYPHNHDCHYFEIQVLELDQKVKDASRAVAFAKEILDLLKAAQKAQNVPQWVIKATRVTLTGILASWGLSLLQSGDLFLYDAREYDKRLNNPVGPDIWYAWTLYHSVPPAPIPFIDPQVPAHMLWGPDDTFFHNSWADQVIAF